MIVDESCLCLSLRRLTRNVSRMYDDALSSYGVTIGQLGILAMISSKMNDNGGPSVQDLADAFDMNQSAMSRTLKPLTRDGLVEDGVSDKDRRRRAVHLTKAGTTKLEEASEAWTVVQKKLHATFTDDELKAIHTMTARVIS